MNKIVKGLATVAGVLFLSSLVSASPTNYSEVTYNANAVHETSLSAAKSAVIDTNNLGISKLSAQVTAASATIPAVTFYDGKVSTMQITITNNLSLSSAVASAGLLIVTNSGLAPAYASNLLTLTSNYLTLSSTQPYNSQFDAKKFCVNGTTLTENVDWFSDAFTSNTLVNIKNALQSKSSLNYISFSTTATGIKMLSNIVGTVGNAFTLTSSTPAALTASAALFSGGNDQPYAYFTINGTTFSAAGNWAMLDVASNTAISMARGVNRSSMTTGIAATASGNTVTFTPFTVTTSSWGVFTVTPLWGAYVNNWTLTSSTVALVSSATFVGGRDRATLAIGGVQLRNGLEWMTDVNFASMTAFNLSNAIRASTAIAQIVISSSSNNNIVYTTGVIINNPYQVYTTTQGALTLSSAAVLYSGGGALGYAQGSAPSNISIVNNLISVSNQFGNNLMVLYSTSAGTGVAGLKKGTTYYVKNPTSAGLYLSATSSGALNPSTATIISLGNFTLAISTGKGIYTLTPLAYSGTSTTTWSRSNDGINYSTFTTTGFSQSMVTSTTTLTTNGYDFGDANFRYYRFYISAPDNGGANAVDVWFNGKK